MSGNKIGFNEITEIGFNGNYGADLNSRLKAINDNFDKIAKADYMKGVDGDDVRVLKASFANRDNGNPLDKGNLYYNNEEKITKGSLYTSIRNCIAGLIGNDSEDDAINGISWDSGLLENNSIMIIVDEENGNYYLKSSLYFVYNDPRFANPTESAAYGNLKNLSCVVTYDGEKWVASQPFPKIYYSVEANDFCWEINGQPTKLRARGPQGLSGQNYPVWLCASSVNNIKELTQDEQKIDNTISIQVEGIYRLEGTEYNYITPPTEKIPDDEEGKQKWEENKQKWERIIDKEEFKNNMALCIVHDVKDEENNKLIKLYCGYLYKQENNLYIYSSQNSAIDTIIGHKTLYSLLKSNSPGNTIQNSLFIPTGHVNIDGSLSGKQIYSIYGCNETVTETSSSGDKKDYTHHTFNIGVSTVKDDQTLTQQIGRTKLNLWANEINFKTGWPSGKINFNVGNDALQITSDEININKNTINFNEDALQITPNKININRNLISSHNNNGVPQRYIQMKLPESYLTFESYVQRNLSDSLSPIDTAMNPEACANRLSFYNPDLVDIEYSADGGGTWKNCFDNSDDAYKIKTKLLTTGFKDTVSNLYLGKKFNTKGTFSNKDKLRVSIYIRPGEFYGRLDKINLYTAYGKVDGLQMKCDIHLYKAVMPYDASNSGSITPHYVDTNRKDFYDEDGNGFFGWDVTTISHNNLSGEPGWNSIPMNGYTIGGYNNASDGGYNFLNNRIYKIVFEYGLEGSDGVSSQVARVCGIRLFGSSWYVVKDKNRNTNSLASYNSICSWDENGAVVFPAGVSNQFKITYKKLKDLSDNGKLVPGTKYRITDYLPKFNGTDIKSGEHQFDIIVEATDNKTLSEKVSAVLHDGDTYFENSKLNKWELKYSLNTSGFDWVATDDPGVIYYMKDEFDNEASYDFKNVMYELNISNDDPSPRNYIIYSLLNKYKKNIITKYLTDHSGQFDQNLMTWIQKGTQITLAYNCQCSFYTFSSIYIDNLQINNADEANISCTFDVKTKDYSFTEFCHNNILGKNSLYNIFITAVEQSGISYATRNNKLDINCTNNIFGENCTNNIFGENCKGNNFAGYCSYNCFENSCRDNNCDEYFKGNKLGGFSANNIFGKKCSNNIIKTHLIQSTFGNNCDNNIFGVDVSITGSTDNDTSYKFVGINFGNNCLNNNLGTRCYDINFGDNCHNNNLGQMCYDINFGENCSNNNLGQGCRYIIFNRYCSNNNFGSNNSTIKTSSNSKIANCTIGNECTNILFIHPLTCRKDSNSVIYKPVYMEVEGAKIGNKCKGLIISISKKITEGDDDYAGKYASFLLYNTDSDNNYARDYLENTLKPRRILPDVRLGSCEIEGLNIYSNTDRYKVDKTDSVTAYSMSDDTMLVTTNLYNLGMYNPESWSVDDLDKIFVDGCMMALSNWVGGGSNVFAILSCKHLKVDKSVCIFHMHCETSASENNSKKEIIIAKFP